ncbi:MAG: HAD family hydrolase [Eubacteriales bacterium]|nr:HAD family hydrolase [Eubacteriales bacterium]
MFRLIATDVDGTLLQEGAHDLDPAYYDIIQQLSAKGISFCVCSGRQYHSIRQMFAPVAEDIFYIAENGTLVRTAQEILHIRSLEPEACVPLIEEIRRIPGADMVVSGPDLSWVDSGEDSHLYHLLKDHYQYRLENIPDLTAVPPAEIIKISVYHAEGDRGLQGLLRSRWNRDLELCASGVTWVDICPKNAGKGTALAFLQQHLGVSREETLYFGDNMNDLPAFARAGLAGTVENARPEVKEKADFVADRYEDLGVLKKLRQIFEL